MDIIGKLVEALISVAITEIANVVRRMCAAQRARPQIRVRRSRWLDSWR